MNKKTKVVRKKHQKARKRMKAKARARVRRGS